MKCKIKFHLTLLLGFLFYLNTYSQIICYGDTFSLDLAIYRGNLQWQESNDNSIWTDISGATFQPYLIKAISTKYYRAKVIDRTCNPIYSAFKKITVISAPSPPNPGINISSQTQIIWNWNTSPDATGYKWNTINNYMTSTDIGTNTSYKQTGLTCSTFYHLYVWAYNSCGNSTVTILTQNTIPSTYVCGISGTFVDTRDGQTYGYVDIGTQRWMCQNLNTTKYLNGDSLSNGIGEWISLSTGAYCNYNNDGCYAATYGRLYNWYAINDIRKICPLGWHVPTFNEWDKLNNYLGGFSVAGGKMKEGGIAHWSSPNIGATNTSGFTALPSGERSYTNGSFYNLGKYGFWWVASTDGSFYSYYADLLYNDASSYLSGLTIINSKNNGFSIRCVTDCSSPPSSPSGSTNIPSQMQIVWNWNTASGATGYKWNIINNYYTAIDNGTSTSYTQIGLGCDTSDTLYVWAYNGCGSSTVTTLTQTTFACPYLCGQDGTFIDARDGQTYGYVNIGSQIWMCQNLNATKYLNGEAITNITEDSDWDDQGEIFYGAYCNYNNDLSNSAIYGKLYFWAAANDSRGLCPTGWHLPSKTEWDTLINYLGGANIAGGAMKEEGLPHWQSPNTGATNTSGFTAIPGGYRDDEGSFGGIGSNANWWSSTDNNNWLALSTQILYDRPKASINYVDKGYGLSVRCVKD